MDVSWMFPLLGQGGARLYPGDGYVTIVLG
jgi:hypothetical protein